MLRNAPIHTRYKIREQTRTPPQIHIRITHTRAQHTLRNTTAPLHTELKHNETNTHHRTPHTTIHSDMERTAPRTETDEIVLETENTAQTTPDEQTKPRVRPQN